MDSVQGAQTADRALQLLLLMAHSDRPLDLGEASKLAGLNKAVTRRLLQALMKHQLVARVGDDRRYAIGSGMVALSALVMSKLSVREAALAPMQRLARLTSETVSLHVRHARHRVSVASVEGIHPIRWVVPLGETLPLYVGLSGRVILAHLPPDEIADVLRWAAGEGVDTAAVEEALQRVRAQGYLADVGARIAGLGGLSVPVFDASGVVAALTISGPGERFSREVAESVAVHAMRESRQISEALGHRGTAVAT
jgi:IclR family acetate operon transcriptional repressor